MITTISIEWWKVKTLDTINPGCRNFYRLHKTLPTICIHCPPPSNPTLVHTNHTLLAITGHLYRHMALSNTHKHTRESFTHSHRHTHTLDALIWCMFAHTLTTHLVWASERAQQTHPAKKKKHCLHLKSCSELWGSREVEWAGKGLEIRNDNPIPNTVWSPTSIRPVAQVSALRLLGQACLDTITFPTQPWTWTWVLSRCERWRSCWFGNMIQRCLYFIVFKLFTEQRR